MSREDKLVSFYKQCVNKGYTNMADDTQSLKAKVIAMDLGLRYRRIENLFEEAKDMYEDERAWQAKKRQQWEAEQEKMRQERNRLAADGEWIMTVYDYLSGEKEGREVAFYRRPDKSIYYKENGGIKKEGQPSFSVESVSTVFYNYHEGKTVYTGATVGGITTGGFHTEAPYMSEHKQYTGKGEIIVSYDGKRFEAKRVRFPAIIAERFHRDSAYWSYVRGEDYLLVASSIHDNKAWQSLMQNFDRIGQYNRLEQFSNAKADTLYSKETCREIVKFLDRIVRGDYPKSDKERFESVANIPEDANAATLKHTIDELSAISGYDPADALRRTLQPRYETVLQQEKEAEVLRREKVQKKRKVVVPIVIVLIVAALALAVIYAMVIVPNSRYNNAVALMNEGNYDEAIAAFSELDDYKDSTARVEEAKLAKKEAAYANAEALLNTGDYEGAIAAFLVLVDYKDSAERAEEAKLSASYASAEDYFNSGNYAKAAELFNDLGNYRDSREKLAEARQFVLNYASVGDVVTYGMYYYNSVDLTGDKVPVEWIVLQREGNQLLLMSKYLLGLQKYSLSKSESWDSSYLREWLNGSFYEDAFSKQEQENIIWNPLGKVYILSVDELEKYLGDFEQYSNRSKYTTSYVSYVDNVRKNTQWWTRSPDNYFAGAQMKAISSHYIVANSVTSYGGVRPVITIDLN